MNNPILTCNKINGVLHTSLPPGSYLINGNMHHIQGTQQYTVSEEDVICPVTSRNVYTKAVSSTGEEHDYETYSVMVDMAKIAHMANPDDLDVEFHYRKLTKWNVLSERRDYVGEPYRFVVKHEIDNRNAKPYTTLKILSLTSVADESPFSMYFDRRAFLLEKVDAFLEEHDMALDRSHSDMQYWKMGHKKGGPKEYCFNGDVPRYFQSVICGEDTYDSVLEKTNIEWNKLRSAWMIKFGLTKELDKEFANTILADLSKIKSEVIAIDSKMKTYSCRTSAIQKIGMLEENIKRRITG